MSYASKVSDSDTDAEDCYPLRRRHRYNTRSTVAKTHPNDKKIVKPKRKPRARSKDSSPTFGYAKNFISEDVPRIMDYCFEPCINRPRRERFWCRLCKGTLYILILIGIGYIAHSLFLVNAEIQKIKEEIRVVRGSNKKEDPHAKLAKELDKKCSDTLKLLLKDPIGRPDFALESVGGRIVTVEAAMYTTSPNTFLGLTICEGIHGPSAMIRATTNPGECWAFKGNTASAVIELMDYVMVDSVTLEHIPPTISPSGTIDTAPKDFKIWGLEYNSNVGKNLLGQFTYENGDGAIQSFSINNDGKYFKFVEFEVLSNHGNKDFTCVYRLRVHGTLRKFS